jgi:hypothetical protein
MGITQEQWDKEAEASKKNPRLKKPSEGYFLASHEVQEKLAGRLDVLNEKLDKLRVESNATGIALVLIEIDIVTKIRDQMRNTLLWDTQRGE